MFLQETPHIKLRRHHDLIYIDYTQCDILEPLKTNPDTAAARSYNTIIGIYTIDNNSNKIYLETAGVYSTTTATKHKPRAARLADHNGYKIIPNIKPDILFNFYFYPEKVNITELLTEYQDYKKLLQELQNNDTTGTTLKHLLYTGTIKTDRTPKTTNYKNSNRLVKYYYKTNFKYFSNIYYQVNQKETTTTIKPGNYRDGYRPERTYNKVKNTIVNIRS